MRVRACACLCVSLEFLKISHIVFQTGEGTQLKLLSPTCVFGIVQIFPSVRALLSTSWDPKIRRAASVVTEAAANKGAKANGSMATSGCAIIGIMSSEDEAAYGVDGNGCSGDTGGGGEGGGEGGIVTD
jgi:hypothetical protein